MNNNVHCVYGDAANVEFLAEFDMKDAKMIISTISDFDVNMTLIAAVRQANKRALVIVTAKYTSHALEFYAKGADYVIMPHNIGGQHAVHLMTEHEIDYEKFIKEKIDHINDLKERHATFASKNPNS